MSRKPKTAPKPEPELVEVELSSLERAAIAVSRSFLPDLGRDRTHVVPTEAELAAWPQVQPADPVVVYLLTVYASSARLALAVLVDAMNEAEQHRRREEAAEAALVAAAQALLEPVGGLGVFDSLPAEVRPASYVTPAAPAWAVTTGLYRQVLVDRSAERTQRLVANDQTAVLDRVTEETT